MAFPWVPIVAGAIGSLFGPKEPEKPDPNQYLPQGWQQGQQQSYDWLRQTLGMGAPDAEEAYYGQAKERLGKERDEMLKWTKNDALRRGIYNSGILTENYGKVNENYMDNIRRVGQDAAVYNQGQRWNALQALMSGRPMGYDVWGGMMGDYGYQQDKYRQDRGNWFSGIGNIVANNWGG